MRYVAPTRAAFDRRLLGVPPLSRWAFAHDLLGSDHWPDVAALNALPGRDAGRTFVTQDVALLSDGLHYEERIANHGAIATRADNWHDLLNALVWLRYPALKRALNARQMVEIALMGRKQRSRPQCALTHFDEAGLLVVLSDPAMLDAWDVHDWHGLFWRHRDAWLRGDARVEVFGHALLEHALTPDTLLVGKALVVMGDASVDVAQLCANVISDGSILRDPQELRPLPVSGVPGWHTRTDEEAFYREAACFQPLRAGRTYPPALLG
ncbi:hypothetical protein FHW69_003640 [Luteibacter sp. Sphag1AF]|uniref:DUF3025 domain-containing protein n=1 Tax=Luteibacter sp. Sphag1AF TaxID=2587031 RepID=UPI001610B3CF|nr:DUF3025 domain-containing protein [Luteibacter sp. Sphag1AF]MBB3228992.1 hypothetical protein [Luteibacter sp. Sphag1AF]